MERVAAVQSQRRILRTFVDAAIEERYRAATSLRVRRSLRILVVVTLLGFVVVELLEGTGVAESYKWLGGTGNLDALLVIRGFVTLPILIVSAVVAWACRSTVRSSSASARSTWMSCATYKSAAPSSSSNSAIVAIGRSFANAVNVS